MSGGSSIEWTDHTFNPWWGCEKVSPGCANCYAEAWARRTGWDVWGRDGERRRFGESHWLEPLKWAEQARNAGRRMRVFCASMADVFEDRRELDEHRRRLFSLIEETPALDWLLLTKRPENAATLVPVRWLDGWPANAWAGTTAEDQARADERIPKLLEIPAPVRFVSAEPLLGPLDLLDVTGGTSSPRDVLHGTVGYGCAMDEGGAIDWLIVGGESGPGARPCEANWIRSLVAQAHRAAVPCFVKQLGAHYIDAPNGVGGCAARPDPALVPPIRHLRDRKGGDPDEWPNGLRVREFPEAVLA